MQVCGLIKCADLWADILLRLTQIQTVGFAMFRLLCYVLHNSVAKSGFGKGGIWHCINLSQYI